MVVENLTEIPTEIFFEIGRIILWLQAIGVVVIVWIIFELIALIVNRKKRKAIYSIKNDLVRIEKKIDKILKKNR
jgi:hypothetical protein